MPPGFVCAEVSTTSDVTARVSPVTTTSAVVSTTSDVTSRVSHVTTTSAEVSTTSDVTTRVSPVTTTSAEVSTTSDVTARVTTTSDEVSTTFDVTAKVSTTQSHEVILWDIEGLEVAELSLVVIGFAMVGVVVLCFCWRKCRLGRLRSNPSVVRDIEERPVFPHPPPEESNPSMHKDNDSDLIHFDDETDPGTTPTHPRSSSPIQSLVPEIPSSLDLGSDITVQTTLTHTSGYPGPDYTPSPIHTPEHEMSESLLDSTVISAASPSLPKEQNQKSKSSRSPILTRAKTKERRNSKRD
ncbi:uncharacterized protein LOC133179890 [Saccostrea echinata]|uniref:uncharacterized protein LOC133179890 n=1 Tax=Saccostrea echinata TaxID=191078 RepID=UPI002A833D09|nr:uncharacterized protein LOC133179890 [Saccostrea echinata]